MDAAEQWNYESSVDRLQAEVHWLKKEHRRLEEQLIRAQRMETLAVLAGGIAHDFNNLLQCILGHTQLALADQPKKNPEYGIFKKIEGYVLKGCKLTEQVLTLGREKSTRKEALNLNTIITDTAKLLRRTIPKMIDIELDLADGLKQINADAGQCEQVVMNLCLNARDAIADQGKLIIKTENVLHTENLSSSSADTSSERYIRLTISDNGHGIPDKIKKFVYEPFFTTKEHRKGSGLGLSIVYSIIKNHDGFMDFSSQVGRGSVFNIYFPGIHAKLEKSEGKPQPVRNDAYRGNETILIIEDEADIYGPEQQFLQKHGYRVITARSGEEGIALFTQNPVDLVLLDIGMPGMGGTQCLKRLLTLESKLKIIIFSGYPLNGRISEALTLGAKSFLSKPYRFDRFIQKIRQVLDESDPGKFAQSPG